MDEESKQQKQERLAKERACEHDYRAWRPQSGDYAVLIHCLNCGKQKGAYFFDDVAKGDL